VVLPNRNLVPTLIFPGSNSFAVRGDPSIPFLYDIHSLICRTLCVGDSNAHLSISPRCSFLSAVHRYSFVLFFCTVMLPKLFVVWWRGFPPQFPALSRHLSAWYPCPSCPTFSDFPFVTISSEDPRIAFLDFPPFSLCNPPLAQLYAAPSPFNPPCRNFFFFPRYNSPFPQCRHFIGVLRKGRLRLESSFSSFFPSRDFSSMAQSSPAPLLSYGWYFWFFF